MILELRDIHLHFTNARGEVPNLLNGVNLGVERGKITALVGGNGTGKTTLFNIISGFQLGYTGQVLYDGEDISKVASYMIARKGIGRLFQGRQLMGDLTLMENMKIASYDTTGENPFSVIFHSHKIKEREIQKEQLAIDIIKRLFGEDCKYLHMLDHKASSLSYGEQRLIAIARLLMNINTKILLLDEPTAGVNPVYVETIGRLIRRMVDEDSMTILLIEHNMHFVRDIADICFYLNNGKIEKSGPTIQVLDDKEVRNSYLGL